MPYISARDIIEDVLFRASEPQSGSDWRAKTLDYVNRCYRALAAGSSEFLPEFIGDWWWLRERGVLTIEPIINEGTVSLIQGSTAVTFSEEHEPDLVGRRLRIPGQPDIPIINVHGGLSNTASLDAAWTGPNLTNVPYELLRTLYTLDSGAQVIMSPISTFNHNPRLFGTTPERLDELFPLSRLSAGVPRAFALESETQIRMSHGGRTDGFSMRMEYIFRPAVVTLTDSDSSIPLVPLQYRQVLADMALTFVFIDKDDDRVQAANQAAKSMLTAMVKENVRRFAKMDDLAGKIQPRQNNRFPRVPEEGIIIVR